MDDEFNTYQNAFKYLRGINIDSDNCDGVAVKYRVTVWNNLVQDAHQNVCEAYKKYKNIADTEVLDLVPEKMIKCGKCDSRLNREYIKTSFCPLCHEDLRPLEFKKILKSAKEQYEQSTTDFETKSIKFSKIKWLIKVQSKKT